MSIDTLAPDRASVTLAADEGGHTFYAAGYGPAPGRDKIAAGNAQLWAEYGPAANQWWLVATFDGVSTSSLHYSGGLIT